MATLHIYHKSKRLGGADSPEAKKKGFTYHKKMVRLVKPGQVTNLNNSLLCAQLFKNVLSMEQDQATTVLSRLLRGEAVTTVTTYGEIQLIVEGL